MSSTPELPDTDRTFGTATINLVHGPRGYRAVAVGGYMRLVFARTGWHPTIPDALAALATAMSPGFTRSAHRDVTPARDDD